MARRRNPSALGAALAALGVVVLVPVVIGAAMVVENKARRRKRKTCQVDLSEELLQSKQTEFVDWFTRWSADPDEPATTAIIDLMRQLAPQCNWTPTTNAVIHRPDGTTTTWGAVMNALANLKVRDLDADNLTALFGAEPT